MTDIPSRYKLIIFDLDGTLAAFDSTELYLDAQDWLATTQYQWGVSKPHLSMVIASNQGGIGLRHWMESGGFGNPDDYPTFEDFQERIAELFPRVRLPLNNWVLVSAAYQSKKSGKWSPTPDWGNEQEMFNPDWRKPSAGMLVKAMDRTGYGPQETLMVGDSREDELAALSAECGFMWANQFFGRGADWKPDRW